MLQELVSLGSGLTGQLVRSKQTRHATPAPSQGARANSRAVPKGNVWRRQASPGRRSLGESWEQGASQEAGRVHKALGPGRACFRRAKATADVDEWRCEAPATPGVLSDGTRGRLHVERMRSPGVGDGLDRREGRYKGCNPKSCPTPLGEVGGGHSSGEGGTAKPSGAKGLCLSRASGGGGAA
jgi:hypothetical protein